MIHLFNDSVKRGSGGVVVVEYDSYDNRQPVYKKTLMNLYFTEKELC